MKNPHAGTGRDVIVSIKRAYALPGAHDGYRVLVDRLWPRAVSKADARIDEWWKPP